MKNKLLVVALLGFPGLLNFHFTASAQPVVTTLAASGVTTNSATIKGTVNPNGLATTAYIQYGLTSTYGNVGTLSSLPGTFAASALSTVVNSLIDPAGGSWVPRASGRFWTAVASSADGTKLVAGVDNGQLYTSTDNGVTWTPRASNQKWRSIASSADGTKLVAGGDGIIYTSTDSGATWTLRSGVGASSVASSADGTKLVAATGNIYTSTDSGVTWTLRSGVSGSSVASSMDGTKLVVGNYGGQLYTSTDSGVTWTPRENNRNWRALASSADGTKLVAGVDNGQLYTSTDSGVTWTAHLDNDSWWAVASSADGTKLVAACNAGYAPSGFSTGTGHLFLSTNSGVTWTASIMIADWHSVAFSADGTKLVGAAFWSSWLVGGLIYTSAGATHSLDVNTTVHYQSVGINSAGTTLGSDLTFTTLSFPPAATTLPATGVTATTAMLNGTVNPGNGVTAAYFQYGLTAGYGNVSATNTLGATNVTLSVSNLIASLSPGTTYHYRLVGSNSGGTSLGNDLTFTTSIAAPVVTTAAATAITAATATLNGAVNPGNAATTAYFQYGLTTSYGSFSTVNALAANNATVSVSNLITGLSPGTYHYQLLGINSAGARMGADLTFTTSGAGPVVTTAAATAITTTTATLNGTVNPGNGATTYFQYGLTTNYGSVTPPVVLPSSWALDFNDTNQFATTSSNVDLSNRSFSVEFWARRDGSNRWDTPLTQGTANSHHGLQVGFRAGNTFTFAFWSDDLDAVADYSDNAWHHWACTYNQTNNQRFIYRDGVVVAANTASGPYLENSPLLIARSAQLNANFGGALDELRVWNGVRTAAQINTYLNTTVAGAETNLLAYWRFEEGTGASAGDASGHGNIAALAGNPAWIGGIAQPAANAAVTALTANAIYHFRVVASNNGFTNFGGDLTFTTASSQPLNFILVTTTADAGAGSLRNGVNIAPDGSYIFFAPNLSGQTITLTSGQLVVTNDLAIDASALTGGVVVSGNSSSRIFVISNNVTVHLNSLTLINGRSDAGGNGYNGNASNGGPGGNGGDGGAIYNSGALTLTNCTLSGNNAGNGGRGGFGGDGIDAGLEGFLGGGGAPAGNGGNGGNGGAISSSGPLVLTSCTLSGNSAGNGGNGGNGGHGGHGGTFYGAGIGGNGGGGGNGGTAGNGGAVSCSGTLKLTCCTVSANKTGNGGNGGSGGQGGIGDMNSATDNGTNGANGTSGANSAGGGIVIAGSCTLWNTLVALNSASAGTAPDISGSVISQGHNLVGATNGASGIVGGANGNLVGNTNSPIDPMLGPLGNNGGRTATMLVLPGSPAINAGDDAVANISAYDQRGPGFPRLFQTHVDIGAYESGTVSAPTITSVAATAITAATATLNGTVNPENGATTAYFHYGLTTSYGSFSAVNALAANNATVSVSNLITGLSPGTTYHYQLLGINSAGATAGADLTFTTASSQPVNFRLDGARALAGGAFRMSFTNLSGLPFTVMSTTNLGLPLSNWEVLGAPTESPPGQYQFTNSQTTNSRGRFYRVRSP